MPGELRRFTLIYVGVPDRWPSSVVTSRLRTVSPNQSSLTPVQEFEFVPGNMAQLTVAWERMFERLLTCIK